MISFRSPALNRNWKKIVLGIDSMRGIASCASRRIAPTALAFSTRRASFAVSLFHTKIDPVEVFPFPSAKMTDDEVDNLQATVKAIRGGDGQPTSASSVSLTEAGIAGLQIPSEFGGLQLSHSASSLVWEELGQSLDLGLFERYIDHASFATFLLKQCDGRIRGKYLPSMSDGSIVIGLAIKEAGSEMDLSNNQVSAAADGQGSYLISGTKLLRSNAVGETATHFLVLAKVSTPQPPEAPTPSPDAAAASSSTAAAAAAAATARSAFFVVEKGAAGVSFSKADQTVSFNKTQVADMIGTNGNGMTEFLVAGMTELFAGTAVLLGLAKKALSILKTYLRTVPADSSKLPLLEGIIFALTTNLYAAESIQYAFTLNADIPVKDSFIESTLIGAFVRNASLAVFSESIAFADIADSTLAEQLRFVEANAIGVANELPSLDFLRVAGTLSGIEDFGLFFQKCSTLQMMQIRSMRSLGIKDKLPSTPSSPETALVDSAVIAFGLQVEQLFVRQGMRARQFQIVLDRLGECAGLIYASSAAIARSLSCEKKKLPTAKTERQLAATFTKTAMERVHALCADCASSGKNSDELVRRVSIDLCNASLN